MPGSADTRYGAEITAEQTYVSTLYARLDEMRELASARLATALRDSGGTPQARSERESAVVRYGDQVAQIDGVADGLCFGRLDLTGSGEPAPVAGSGGSAPVEGGERRYIGRIGIFDGSDDYRPLLVDWRADAARPFYLATAASPEGVRRRRHIRTKGRTVVGLDDEVLDLADAEHDVPEAGGLTSEAALLAAVTAHRTGRMRDIVETIQAEQDRVIRSDLAGVLVVQGGPGTGKTAVALHRAAYLLYTHRDLLSTRGVLIVGPNQTFLRYISQVLPSLAETGVLLSTMEGLFPGVTPRHAEDPVIAEVKGRLSMVDILAAAVADRQAVPPTRLTLAVEQDTLTLEPGTVAWARNRARASGRRHNQARDVFADAILTALAEQVAERVGTDPYAHDPLGEDDAPGDENLFDAADLADIRGELAAEPAVRELLDELWPVLTPQRLLADLYTDPERIRTAAAGLTEREQARLFRPAGPAWTPADVPLLDEAVELLGEVPAPAGGDPRTRRFAADLEYARGALEIAHGSRSLDAEHHDESELLSVTDLLDAGLLASRHEFREHLTTAERAAADRTWAFGHVIVDEAQELSPMAWRLLMRRCPSRSMTVVGDVAQTGDLGGVSSWAEVLSPYVADRWRHAELTVNYRTPAEIMAEAATVLARIDPALTPPRSVRDSGEPPWRETVAAADLAPRVIELVLREAALVGAGRLGIIVPVARAEELARPLTGAMPEVAVGEQPELERSVVVLTVRQAKGLEFDSVVVVDPDRIVAESARGESDLYVALTRATHRLGVLTVD